MPGTAIGFIETRGMVGVIEAADAAAKSAAVEIVRFEQVGAGLVSVLLSGDVASVQAAVAAGVTAASQLAEVVSHHVIAAPHADLGDLVGGCRAAGPRPDAPVAEEIPRVEDLSGLPVARLRQLVRQEPGSRLRGRDVSRATKSGLIEELRRLWGRGS